MGWLLSERHLALMRSYQCDGIEKASLLTLSDNPNPGGLATPRTSHRNQLSVSSLSTQQWPYNLTWLTILWSSDQSSRPSSGITRVWTCRKVAHYFRGCDPWNIRGPQATIPCPGSRHGRHVCMVVLCHGNAPSSWRSKGSCISQCFQVSLFYSFLVF